MLGQVLLDAIYPVGRIITTESATDNPNNLYNGTGCKSTWIQYGTGKVLVGIDTTQDEFKTIGQTGGSKYLQEHQHKLIQFLFNGGSSTGTHYGIAWSENPGDLFESGNVTAMPSYVGEVKNTTTGNSGNLQPYIVVYRWKRTA